MPSLPSTGSLEQLLVDMQAEWVGLSMTGCTQQVWDVQAAEAASAPAGGG